MSSWHDVDHSLGSTPIQGSVSSFRSAEAHFFELADTTTQIAQAFGRLSDGDRSHFAGETANAFVMLIDDMVDDLRDLPQVARDIAVIFGTHAHDLEEIKARVGAALARALTSRRERDLQASSWDRANATLRSVERQINTLQWQPDEDGSNQTQLVRLRGQATVARNERSVAANRRDSAQHDINHAIDQYGGFGREETELNRRTGRNLDGVDLRNLSDPSNAEKFLRGAGNLVVNAGAFIVEYYADMARLGLALLSGNLDEALWRLNDVLRSATVIFGILCLFVPGIGPLLTLAIIGFGLAAATLVTSSLLAHRGTINSETGEYMTWDAYRGDLISTISAGVGLGLVYRAQVLTRMFSGRTRLIERVHNNPTWGARDRMHRQALLDHQYEARRQVDRQLRMIERSIDRSDDIGAVNNVRDLQEGGDAARERGFSIPAPRLCDGPTRGVVIACR